MYSTQHNGTNLGSYRVTNRENALIGVHFCSDLVRRNWRYVLANSEAKTILIHKLIFRKPLDGVVRVRSNKRYKGTNEDLWRCWQQLHWTRAGNLYKWFQAQSNNLWKYNDFGNLWNLNFIEPCRQRPIRLCEYYWIPKRRCSFMAISTSWTSSRIQSPSSFSLS